MEEILQSFKTFGKSVQLRNGIQGTHVFIRIRNRVLQNTFADILFPLLYYQ